GSLKFSFDLHFSSSLCVHASCSVAKSTYYKRLWIKQYRNVVFLHNILCLCNVCHGLLVQQNCTTTTDTVCDVSSGYYCKSVTDSSGCSLAEKHSQCVAGQRIKEPGTSRSDTVCEDCQPRSFSKDGVTCTAWTICSKTQIKIKEGSSTSDVVCGSAPRQHNLLIAPFSFFAVAVIGLVAAGLVKAG
uniref:TNFR-Cys domain-containing protein n=1 Tax=Amphilophus citrinellus TaxID=61819 RepID=A0A3Q0RDJ2_AMPCI